MKFVKRILTFTMPNLSPPVRWAVVGLTTTAIDYIVFINFYTFTNSVFFSNLLAGTTATTFNYLTHHRWTFKSDQQYLASGIKYILNFIFWWIVSTAIIEVLVNAGVDVRLAKLAPLVFIVQTNYFVLNKVVFKKKI